MKSKKMFVILLTSVMALSMVGCGQQGLIHPNHRILVQTQQMM